MLDLKEVVYVDESGFSHGVYRTHGYSRIGKRCFGKYEWSNKKRTNVIGALLNNKLIAGSLFDTSIDSDIFYEWINEDLLPNLKGTEVIVMDNASFHKRKDIVSSISNKGCELLFLPAYSPDLNPIEHKWALAKSIRKKENCSVDDLFRQYLL
jgi:transposase